MYAVKIVWATSHQISVTLKRSCRSTAGKPEAGFPLVDFPRPETTASCSVDWLCCWSCCYAKLSWHGRTLNSWAPAEWGSAMPYGIMHIHSHHCTAQYSRQREIPTLYSKMQGWNTHHSKVKYPCRKGAIPHKGHQWGANLPFSGHWAHRWIDHWVCDAWPVQRQTYSYLPSCKASPPFGQYQIILLGEKRHTCVNNLPKVVCHLAVHWVRAESATSWSSVRHATATPSSQTVRWNIPSVWLNIPTGWNTNRCKMKYLL